MNPEQCLLILVPWFLCCIEAHRRKDANLCIVCHLGWSSFVLMSLVVGTHHDVPGYWAYPAVFGFVCTGWLIDRIGQTAARSGGRLGGSLAHGGLAVAVGAMLLPGSGLRLTITHLRHWNDVNYNAPAFARQLMERLPPDARCTVDHEYLLDFLAAGRPVTGLPTSPVYLNAEDVPYDYLVVSRFGLRYDVPRRYCGLFEASAGIKSDELACYAELHRPSPRPCRPVPYEL
jgi:hypothetical protein